MTIKEQNRTTAAAMLEELKEHIDKVLDFIELEELGLTHGARVHAVNTLISQSITTDYVINSLEDIEND